jgi:hypothetical protein
VQWPFKEWGADAVLTGHEHVYERLTADGLPYLVNGLGGNDRRVFGATRPCSEMRYREEYGAMLVEATAVTMTFQFINLDNQVIDTYRLPAPATPQICTSTYVQDGADDVEQSEITGTVYIDGLDLELTKDLSKDRNQVVGVRFQQVTIPPGATILAAMLEFYNRKEHDEPTSLLIQGVAADHASPFGTKPFAVSAMSQTVAAVPWNDVVPWLNLGYPEPSPDVSAILQELVDRPGWQSGNAVSLILTGSGVRTTYSYEDNPDRAVGLTFRYEMQAAGSSGKRQVLPFVAR